MCGINGIFAYHYAANSIDQDELVRTRDHMAKRGPDGKGKWISADGRAGFGHRRLSIIDLTGTGAQPMESADGRYVVTFNGEIYNHKELRCELEARGRVFASTSDTEVLLHLYAEKGQEMMEQLRGMFAFAIWDKKQRSLFLARDPYGIKPLYYADDGWTFRFASQVKALLASGAVSRDADPAGRVGFYMWGNVPDPYTSYREIRSLPAGSILYVGNVGAHEPECYRRIGQIFKDAEDQSHSAARLGQASEVIREALLDSVRHHLVADVQVGVFLSAGIDSSSLVGLMRDAGKVDIETITIAFEEFRGTGNDESIVAADIARHYGTKHTQRIITEREFRNDLPIILDAMDQPTIDGINTWFVSKAARESGLKVAISGLGGDELFGGYPSFAQIPGWTRRLGAASHIPFLGRAIRRVMSSMDLQRWSISPKAAGMVELGGSYTGSYFLRRGLFMPWELEQILDRDTLRCGLDRLKSLDLAKAAIPDGMHSAFAKVATLESSLYLRNQLLRDADWASMAHGLEVRVPLVDHVLASKVAPHLVHRRVGEGKKMLAAAPLRPVPAAVSSRCKTGFTTPIEAWIEHLGDDCDGRKQLRAKTLRHWSRNWAQHTATQQWGVSPVAATS